MPVGRIERVLLIGCGGTGGILAEHLARMIAGFRIEVELVLQDGDTVEEPNIARQNFLQYEVGANKAEAIALRLAGQFGMPITARPRHFEPNEAMIALRTLAISCTDTLKSRRTIADRLGRTALWIDAGNELDHGQAVIGTTHEPAALRRAFWRFAKDAHATALPDIAALNPKILTARRTKAKAGCADQPFAQQGFGVNAAAAIAAATLAKQVLVDRDVTLAGLYFNVAAGRCLPRTITRDLYRPWRNRSKGKQ